MEKYFSQKPLCLVDGGALGGLKFPWSTLASHVRAISFEPQDDEVATALFSEKKDSVPFYITAQGDSSSLLMPDIEKLSAYGVEDRYTIKKTINLATDTLDAELQKQGVTFVDFIKLDTQGTELHILKGAEHVLSKSVFGVEVEVNFFSRYKGQYFFSDVDAFLRAKGFEIFDLERRYCKRKDGVDLGKEKGQMTHGTALYFRSFDSILKIIESMSSQEKSLYVAHAMAVMLLYGYADTAQAFLSFCKNLVSQEEYKEFRECVESYAKTSVRPLGRKGSYKLWRIFSRFAETVKPLSSKGTSGDKGLGNL